MHGSEEEYHSQGRRREKRRRRGWSFWDMFDWDIDVGRGPRRRGRRSMFGKGDLKFVILRLLADKPMHGYQVMGALEEECGGWYKASPGSVYPTLQMLEDQGHLTVEEKDGKKVYSITDQGRDYLEENEEHVDTIFARFGVFSDDFKDDMKDMYRSFMHLSKETFESAHKWTEDHSIMEEMREILDEAQEKIREAKARAREAARAARQRRRKEAQAETADSSSDTADDGGASDSDDGAS